MAGLPYNNFYSTRTDEQVEKGDWEKLHEKEVLGKLDRSPGATHEEIYKTMITKGLFYAIKYYTGHKDQARAVKDSTEYPFAARAAFESLNQNRPVYEVDTRTDTVVERPALWGGSKRFKKKSRRRHNRKSTRRRRRKH